MTVPQILPWSQAKLSFLAWCHIAGILCPWIGSFLYHLFMNLHRGPKTYYFLLQVDMLGIWVSQSFGKLPWNSIINLTLLQSTAIRNFRSDYSKPLKYFFAELATQKIRTTMLLLLDMFKKYNLWVSDLFTEGILQ